MTATAYRPGSGAVGVEEAHGVLAGVAEFGGVEGLTCRLPEGRTPRGFVVFCHGLGSSGREYGSLSRHWASHGYLVIHPTFADAIDIVARAESRLGLDPEADNSRWSTQPAIRARMHEILHTPARWMERLDAVGRVVDALPQIFAAVGCPPPGALPGAVAGHSFGAYTAQLLAGAEIDMPGSGARSFRDPRLSAAILLSAQGRDQQGLRDGSWDGMTGPVLNVTGTLDRGAKGGDWHWKCEPYELAPAGGKYLAVLDGGDHFLGGLTERDPHDHVPAQQEAVRQVTLAFLDAYLGDSRHARDWLGAIGGRIGDCKLMFKHK